MAFRESYPLDHATHVPVLIGLGAAYQNIRRVFEFGSGYNSTLLFANKLIFPNLEMLVSLETDPEWFVKMSAATRGFQNVTLAKEVHVDLGDALGGFDLVFIDNHPWEHKIETIRKVATTFGGMVVVHDSEEPLYESVLSELPNRVDFTTFNPETTVGGRPRNQIKLQQLARQIDEHKEIDPNDVFSWSQVFRRRL